VLKVAMTFQLENKKSKEQSRVCSREQGKNAPDRGQSR
jgi:hypothetical protein